MSFINHYNLKYINHFSGSYTGIYLIVFLTFTLFSCEKKNDEELIPSFISSNKVTLTTDYFSQGSNSHNITDIWLYVDDQIIGAYELPCRIPVLASGLHDLRVAAGVKLNGISSTRIAYPFYEPFILKDINLVKDSIIIISPGFQYKTSTNFTWLEDFEDLNFSLDSTQKSSVDIELTPLDSPIAFEGSHSGIITLIEDSTFFEIASNNAYVLPQKNTPVVLELNYKSNTVFLVGVFVQGTSTIIQKPVLYINPSEDWNKIYINLTQVVTASDNPIDFKIFFGGMKNQEVDTSTVLLDNIKLLYQEIGK